jgi:SAM-dependent methyltransferase
MAFRYENVVPWGRSYEEYLRMFDLRPDDLKGRILGCADGPARFNSELTRRGGAVVSVDPLYEFSADEIAQRIEETRDEVISQTRREQHRFVWDTIGSVEELARIRMAAMKTFLDDYESGKSDGRYLAAGLPDLPFEDQGFDLALSAHLLFFYTDQLPLDFHRAGLLELCRVAREVRIFPLVDVNGVRSRHLEPILAELESSGLDAEIREVRHEFQRGGKQMLRIRARE